MIDEKSWFEKIYKSTLQYKSKFQCRVIFLHEYKSKREKARDLFCFISTRVEKINTFYTKVGKFINLFFHSVYLWKMIENEKKN